MAFTCDTPEEMPPAGDHLASQICWLLILAVPIACVAWTVTHEDIFREPRDFCVQKSKICASFLQRKFFYLFTCEYCFSHYVTVAFIWFTHFKLLLDDWRGYVLAFFAEVWISNAYMSLFSRLRVDIRSQRVEADIKTREVEVKDKEIEQLDRDLAKDRRENQT
jgi:hypothetical protein